VPVTALAVACGAAAVTPAVAWVARRAWARLRRPWGWPRCIDQLIPTC